MFDQSKSIATRMRVASLIAVLVLPAALGAQATVAGTVTSARDNAPLGDVTLFVLGRRRVAMTDAEGRYQIAAVPAGAQRIVAQRVGYAADTLSANVTETGVVTIDVKLKEAAVVVAPVVVSATQELQDRNQGSMTIDALTGTDVRVTRAGHPAEIMNKLAGVHMSQLSGEGHSMAIRMPISTAPWYLYLEDGIPTRPTGFFNHNALYEVNLPQSAGIEVIK